MTGKIKTKTTATTPVQMLANRKEQIEAAIAGADRDLRSGERKRERLGAYRSSLLEELRGVSEAIERLGGLPKDA